MYSPVPRVGAPPPGQLGFLLDVAKWVGGKVVDEVTDRGSGGTSIEQYYPAVKGGQLMCPGPYDIQQVAAALASAPELRREVDALLSTDPGWTAQHYGAPSNDLQRASALVNWAHGGRDCTVKGAESGYAGLVERILQAGAARAGAPPGGAGTSTGDPWDLSLDYDPGGAQGGALRSALPWLAVAAVGFALLRR